MPRSLPDTAAWILAAGSIAAAASVWTGEPRAPAPPAVDEAPELTQLRRSLARLGAGNESLRRELERLAARAVPVAALSPAPDGSPSRGAADSGPAVANDELARRARERVLGAVGGDERQWEEALDSLVELINESTDAFAVLREIYLATDDVRTRNTVLPLMFYGGGGEESLAFIASEMISLDDLEARRNMLGAVAKTIHPRVAGVFKGAFLAGLEMDDFRARAAGVFGLRHVQDPDVTEALFTAASDPSEPVRKLAIDALANRGADRERLEELIRRDPSPELRRVGECVLTVADEG